jgi:hypothetical protein
VRFGEMPRPMGAFDEEGKLDTLREAVLNPTAPLSPDESLHQMFLSWADHLTVWHLRLLAFFDDPKGWFAARGRKFSDFM